MEMISTLPGHRGPSQLAMPRRVAFTGVSKRFASTAALQNVSLTADRGTVHSLTGENGAGKSTLMKLLSGVYRPSEGTIQLDGAVFAPKSPQDSLNLGVSTIYQELNLISNLSVSENLFFGREPHRFGLVERARLNQIARDLLSRINMSVDPRTMCGDMSIAEQQFIEIAKGLSVDAKVYIFDEPTAALNLRESERLFELIDTLRSEGKLIFYISHRLDEVFRLSDVISVLKDGQLVSTFARGETNEAGLVHAMVGRELGDYYPPRATTGLSSPKLNVEQLETKPGSDNLSFILNKSEIVGLAGLEGQGQREIMRALSGLQIPHVAKITLEKGGEWREVHPKEGIVRTIREGLGFIPEDRKTEGLFLSMSIERNVALGHLRLFNLFNIAPRTTRRIGEMMDRLRLKAAGLEQKVKELSGGNQQKVMLGRWMASGVEVLLIEGPTRGVDVGAKGEIYANLRQFASEGGAILITSSELTELIGLCDRILVVRNNRIVKEILGHEATEELVMKHAILSSKEQVA